MKLSEQVKPISYLKAHAPEIIRGLAEGADPVIITLHGEAKAVLQDIDSYEQTQETLALLKILALGAQDVEQGRVRPFGEALADIRRRVKL
jgi:prevent-host-death family protein